MTASGREFELVAEPPRTSLTDEAHTLWGFNVEVREAGQVVAVVEAMKMENEVTSLYAGTVEAVHVQAGQGVQAGQVLLELAGE